MVILKLENLNNLEEISKTIDIDKKELVIALKESFYNIVSKNIDIEKLKFFYFETNDINPNIKNIIIGIIRLGNKLKIDINIPNNLTLKDMLAILYFLTNHPEIKKYELEN